MASENITVDSGDEAWMMTATVLTYMMTPALAFFYGGLVENKNILNQLFLSLICIAIVTVQWCLFGFSFVFGPGNSAFGSFQFGALRFQGEPSNFYGLKPDGQDAATYPVLTFVAYQGAVAVITPALISGAVVGRMKLIPYMVFVFLWTTVCYDPLCRWTFYKDGWLKVYGSLDFAGGTAVHIASGVSGLVAAVILGHRHDYDPMKHISNNNLPFTVLGTGFLWVGWNGYNAGASLASDGYASLSIVNTNVSAAGALLAWVVTDAIRGTISISGACSGLLVGLVGIAPAAGYVEPGYSLLIGVIVSQGVYWWLKLKKYFLHIDDTLDTFSCHGMGAIIGGLLTGLFAQLDVNPNGGNGAIYGNPIQIWRQLAGILTTIGFAAVCTMGILLPMHFTIGVRLSSEDQKLGMDIHGHGEAWNRNARASRASGNRVSVPNNRPTTPNNQPATPNNHPTTPNNHVTIQTNHVVIPTIQVPSPINEVTPVDEITPVETQIPRRFRRHSVRDFLQEAFT